VANRGYRFWGKVLDGTKNAPIEQGVVVTEGERIAWIGETSKLPRQYAT
jgi:hypothetical protein